MDNFEKVEHPQTKKVWRKPELEMFELKKTEYWEFDESGEFPKNAFVFES